MKSTNEPVAWKDMAFARLGVVRDKMRPEDVLTVQRFLDGDYIHPQNQKKDEALRLALEALKFSTSPAPSVAELQNDAITLIEQALENK